MAELFTSPIPIKYGSTEWVNGESAEVADLTVSRYETICTNDACGFLVFLTDVPKHGQGVRCPYCQTLFLTGLPEHCYA